MGRQEPTADRQEDATVERTRLRPARPRRSPARRLLRVLGAALLSFGVLLTAVAPASADREWSWTLDKDKNPLGAPLPYLFEFEIDGLYKESGTFKNPADIFIDHQFNVWIADTGNNRVVKFDDRGGFLAEYGVEEGPGKLNAPEGIYISNKGDIWVADRGNGRIVLFAPDGTFVKELGKPRSKLLEEDQVYQPNKLVIDRRGYIYVLNGGGDYRGIFLLDSEGEFRGFFGANRLTFDLMRVLIRTFTTEAQKKQISKVLPTHHANLFTDPRGFIYTVSPLAQKDQIKKLNSIGKDIYTAGDVEFGMNFRRGTQLVRPQFVDVYVDDQGIISALDFNSGLIYQYDQSANLLAIFGGRGSQRGKFELPQSLAGGRDGRVFVLDANRNTVQVFRRTEFAELVHTGSRLYFDGKYQEAADVWREVLRRDANYELAHTGLGKAFFKRGAYIEAMQEYQIARNKDGYSLAFGEWRHSFLRENFGWILPLVIFAVWVIATLVARTFKRLMSMQLETEGSAA
jgi:DNA-binding beta-propeller fold protein YncE